MCAFEYKKKYTMYCQRLFKIQRKEESNEKGDMVAGGEGGDEGEKHSEHSV